MAGPKARGATLMQHATTAAGLVSSLASGAFGRGGNASRQNLKNDFAKDEDESDSDSDSETDTSSGDEDRDHEDKDAIIRQLRDSSSAPKPKVNGPNGAKNSAASTPAKKIKVGNDKDTSATKKKTVKHEQVESTMIPSNIKKSPSKTEASSSSDSDSDHEDSKKSLAPKSVVNGSGGDSSQEESESSSGEDDGPAAVGAKKLSTESKRNSGKTLGKATKKVSSKDDASSEDSSESDPESEAVDSPPSRPNVKSKEGVKAQQKRVPQNLKGAENESESESEESDDESEEPEVPKPGATKGTGAPLSKAKESSKPTKKGLQPVLSGKSSANSKSKERVEDSSDSDDSGSDGSDVDPAEQTVLDNISSNVLSHPIQEVLANDFHLQKASDKFDSADVVDFFKKATKEGKQIWYFTAPASVPIEVVQKHAIELDKVQQGQPILSYNGNDYEAGFDDPATTPAIKVIIPSKNGVKYTDRKAVDRTLHIKQVTRFTADGPASSTRAAQVTSAPPRPQPKGLRASYTPIGVPSPKPRGNAGAEKANDESEDVEMAEQPPPPSTQPSAKKRKHRVEEDEATPTRSKKTSTGKKTKKVKTEENLMPSAGKKADTLPSSSQVLARTVTPIPQPSVPKKQTPIVPPTYGNSKRP